MLLDYDLDVDLTNTAERAGGRGADVIGLRAHHQAGARGAPVAGARLWVSYDDGGAWRELPARKRGSARYDFVLDRQDEPGAGTSTR